MKYYRTEVMIGVFGKNWRGREIFAEFNSNNYWNIKTFGTQHIEGFFQSSDDFWNRVHKIERLMLEKAQNHIKITFFQKKEYVVNNCSKVYNPQFATYTKAADIVELKSLPLDYLKKYLSEKELAKLFNKKVYENA